MRLHCTRCQDTFLPEDLDEVEICPRCGDPLTDEPDVEMCADPSERGGFILEISIQYAWRYGTVPRKRKQT